MPGIDDLVAIDVHTHPQTDEFIAAMGTRHTQMAAHFGRERPVVSFAEQADQYRDRRMMAVIVNSDSETTSGIKGAPNDLLGRAQRDHPDVFLAFAGIDPWKGEAAIAEIRRMHDEYGIKGVGEIGLVPTAPAVAAALHDLDGQWRNVLPMRRGADDAD